ncbi:MAG: hypothetical protein ACFFC6_01740 [Promethearchaeota archaeon]
MTFEQEHTEEHEQVQKQIENDQIQQKLDLAIARIQNEQIQQVLDEAIESLDQEVSDQDEKIEEEVIDDHESQQSPSIKEELASDESMTEERSDQQHSLDQSVDTWELTSHQDKNAEEQAINEQEAQQPLSGEEHTSHDSVIEEYLEHESAKSDDKKIIEHQDQASQTPNTEEEISSLDTIIEEDSEQLKSIEASHQSSSSLSELYFQRINDEQITNDQDLTKTKSSLQEEREYIDQGLISNTLNLESLTKNVLQDQKEERNQLHKMEDNHLSQCDLKIKQRGCMSKQSLEVAEEFNIKVNLIEQNSEHRTKLEKTIQSSSNQSIFNYTEKIDKQIPQNQMISVQDPLQKDQNTVKQESLEYLQPSLMMTLMHIGKELGISYKWYSKTWWENMGRLSIDNELWRALKSGNVDSLVDKVLGISKSLGWKSHGGERQIKRICDKIEFKINDKPVNESTKLTENRYTIEYFTMDSDNSRYECLLGFVVKSPIVNIKESNRILITLFPKVAMKYNSEGKIILKFFDRVDGPLPTGYMVYKGYQNEVRLVCINQSSISSKKLIEDAWFWLRNQTVSNLDGFFLEKQPRQTIGKVTSLDEENCKLFEPHKGYYKDVILRLDFFPTWRSVKRGHYRFGHKSMGIPTQANLRIPLKNLIEYYISTQKQDDVPEIGSEIGKVVNINVDDCNKNLKLRVGADYLNIVKARDSPQNKRFTQSFNRLDSRKAIISTLKEFAVYQTLKDHYISKNFQNFAISVGEIEEEALPRIRRVFRVFSQIGGLYESGILQTLEKQGLISKCYTSRNNLIITWVDVSDDVSDSYRYWISKIYSSYIPVTQRQRETLLQLAIAEGFAFEEIEGNNIFSRVIPEGYTPIPVENWEIYIIKGDDEISVIPQLLELTHANSKRNTLVSNATFKSRVKSFIDDHPDHVENIKDNPMLNNAGLEASSKNNMFKEGGPAFSGTLGDGFALFDELFNQLTKKSILGKDFNDLRILKSNQEAVVSNELFISNDFMLIDSQGKVVGTGIAKGVSEENTFTRQVIEQLAEKGKRFVLFPEWDGDTARVYIITFGGVRNNNFDIVKPKNHDALYWESQFHHAIQTKCYLRYYTVHQKEPMQSNYNIDNELIDLVSEKIIENKRNKYPEEIQQRWKNYIEDLRSDLGGDALQVGLPISRFNEWASTRYKSYLTWFSD